MSAEASSSSGRATEILVLHPAALNPTAYIHRLISVDQHRSDESGPSTVTAAPEDDDAESATLGRIPWTIDNKYYSAQVTICPCAQEAFGSAEQMTGEGYEVIMYLFSGRLSSLPPALVRIMAQPRDIALAVRIPLAETPSGAEGEERDLDDLEEMFGELGVEFLDDAAALGAGGADDDHDDERPMPVLDQVRQTLMTHMWPNMVRKSLASATRGIDEYLDDDGEPVIDIDRNDDDEEGRVPSAFPTSFHPSASASIPSITAQTPASTTRAEAEFPGLDELRSQIMLQDTERMHEAGFSRLDMMDDDNDGHGLGDDWVQAEYSRLDDWLDEEGDEGEGETSPGQIQGGAGDYDAAAGAEDDAGRTSSTAKAAAVADESLFEDDFADFAPFQSAPPPTHSSASSSDLPLDPTPLLLHLQNVREELAGLDEDTRRDRAGKEVETLLRSLGLGGLDFEDEDEFAGLDDGPSIPAGTAGAGVRDTPK